MRQTKWFIQPLIIFVLSTVALAISLFLYIHWYVGVSARLKMVIDRYHLDASQFFEARTWVVILVLSILVGIILLGILIIFIYNLKTLRLYRLQHTFINNFTHELKTPVTSLKLFLETFARHELSREEQLKYIGFMIQDIERLSVNINSILNLARIETRVFAGEAHPVDLASTVRQFIDENRHLFRNCAIQVEDPPGGPIIYPVIAPLFEMLLMNILINAIQYNVSEKPRDNISLEPDGRSLLIRFRDNGIGLSREDRRRIFRKFFQGRRNDSIPAAGSGIGLYLVQQVARLHRGRAVADSEGEGKGSVLTVILPYKTKREGP